jgi:hypothetical protein
MGTLKKSRVPFPDRDALPSSCTRPLEYGAKWKAHARFATGKIASKAIFHGIHQDSQ